MGKANASDPFTFEQMRQDWQRERQPRPRAAYEMTSMVRKLEGHLGFSDMSQLTPEHAMLSH